MPMRVTMRESRRSEDGLTVLLAGQTYTVSDDYGRMLVLTRGNIDTDDVLATAAAANRDQLLPEEVRQIRSSVSGDGRYRSAPIGTLFGDCSTLTGYSTLGTGSIALVDTPVQSAALGKATTKSIELTVAAGKTLELVFPTRTAVANPGSNAAAVVELVDGATGGSDSVVVVFYGTDSSLTNSYHRTHQLFQYGPEVIGPRAASYTVGGSPTWGGITYCKIRFTPGSVAGKLLVHGVWLSQSAPRAVALIQDDGYLTAYTDLAPRVARYGWRMGFGIIYDLIGTGAFMSPAHLAALRDDGHDLIPHGRFALSTYASAAEATADIAANAAYLRGIGCSRGVDTYIYPNGVNEFSSADRSSIKDYLRQQNYKAAWLATGGYSHPARGVGKYQLARIDVNETTDVASLLAGLELAIDQQRVPYLMLHQIVNSGATGTDITRTKLDALLDGLRTAEVAGKYRVMSPIDLLQACGLY